MAALRQWRADVPRGPIAWHTMVTVVTTDPLLPKLASHPRRSPPRRARTTLDRLLLPPSVSLSFSLPSLREGGAATFWDFPEAVAAGHIFSTAPVGGPALAPFPATFFQPCAWGDFLAF